MPAVWMILENFSTSRPRNSWNTSGVPWQSLYFKANLPRLQAVKAAWDPHNVFHHRLSVTAP